MQYSIIEYTILNILNYVPFVAIYIYTFRKHLRFSIHKTSSIVTGIIIIYLISNVFVQDCSNIYLHLFTYALMAASILAGFLLIDAGPGQMLFIAFFLKNYADFIMVLAKFFEFLFAPDCALNLYCITYSVSMLVIELVFLPIVIYIIRRFFPPASLGSLSAPYWKFLWLVPLFFYISWIYIFYFPSDHTALEIALNPYTSMFLLLSISCQLFVYICLTSLVDRYKENLRIQEEIQASHIQSIQYKNIMQQINITKEHRHDFRHHLVSLASLVSSEKYDELQKYIDKYLEITLSADTLYYCENVILNNMLVFYANKCKEHDISYDVDMNIPRELVLTDVEISILFGNLLENAFEACIRQNPEKCRIEVKGMVVNSSLVFHIANTVPDDYEFSCSPTFFSSKRDAPGIGTQSCRRIIDKYNGIITWTKEELLYVKFILPKKPCN